MFVDITIILIFNYIYLVYKHKGEAVNIGRDIVSISTVEWLKGLYEQYFDMESLKWQAPGKIIFVTMS
jgi:hypothetical protein